MAAPITVYLGKKFTNHLPGVVKLDSYPALKLAEYGNSIRELFYLHLLLIVKNGNDVGFLGLVEDNPGEDYNQMHAPNRFSKIKIKHPNGKTYVALNDAGLNTYGKVYGELILNHSFVSMQISANFKSSFYDNSTAYGFRSRLRNLSNTGWDAWYTVQMQPSGGALLAKQNYVLQSPGFTGDRNRVMQIQGFYQNTEGTSPYYGALVEVYPTAVPVVLNNTTYYIDTAFIETANNSGFTRLYTSSNFTGRITQGGQYWEDSRYYYTYGYDALSGEFIFLERVDSQNPPNPGTPTTFEYNGYSDSSQAAANANVGSNQNTGIFYLNGNDGRWYQSWTQNGGFAGVPSDGYYAYGDASGIIGEMHLINGISQ